MKILVIGQRWNDNIAGKVSGGMQLSECQQVSTLTADGHEVTVVCTNETDDGYYDAKRVVKSAVSSKQSTWRNFGKPTHGMSAKSNKEFLALVRDVAREVQPEVILNNTFNAANIRLLINMREELGCGVIHIIHDIPVAGVLDISIVNKLELLAEMTTKGGVIGFVSEFQRRMWREFFAKRITEPVGIAAMQDRQATINPIYMDPVPFVDTPNRSGMIMITRMAQEKRIDTIMKMLINKSRFKELALPLTMYISTDKSVEQDEYYQSIVAFIEQLGPSIKVLENRPRAELLQALASCDRVLVSGLQESFGIVPLEASAYGAGTVLFHGKDGSAAFESLGKENLININVREKPADITPFLTQPIVDRRHLHDNVFARFSADVFKSKLLAAVSLSLNTPAVKKTFNPYQW